MKKTFLGSGFSIVLFFGGSEVISRTFFFEWSRPVVEEIYAVDEDPKIGYRFQKNLNATAFGQPLQTNALGFRGENWSLLKNPGVRRIVLIGDSHAFGFGLSEKENFAEVLKTSLEKKFGRRYEVLNFGVPGYNSSQQLEVFQKVASKYSPDIVLLLPCNNDHEPIRKPLISVLDPSLTYFQSRKVLLYRYSATGRLILNQWERWKLSQISKPLRQEKTRWMQESETSIIPSGLKPSVYQPLSRLIQDARALGAKVILAGFAARPDYRNLFNALNAHTGIPVVHLFRGFPEIQNWDHYLKEFGLGWDSHSNAAAVRRWTKYILEESEKAQFDW